MIHTLNPEATATHWTDHVGVVRPVSKPRKKLFPGAHKDALFAFVFRRDHFTCQTCGDRPRRAPRDYDGHRGVRLTGEWRWLVLDHIVSLRNGGTNHPANLQTLCTGCNARKASLIDARHPAALARRGRQEASYV